MPELLGYGSFVGNGRAPQCCPELLLTPNQAGSLAPSRANNEMADPGGNAPPPLPGQGHVLLLHQGSENGRVWEELHLRCSALRHLFYRQARHNWQSAHTRGDEME